MTCPSGQHSPIPTCKRSCSVSRPRTAARCGSSRGGRPTRALGEDQKKLDVQLVHCRPRTAARRCSSLVRQQPRRRVGRKSSCAGAQGEDQKKLDVVSNEVFCNALRNSGRTGIIASEEEDLPVSVEETYSGVALPCPNPTLVHPPGPACFRASRCAGDRSLLGRDSVCDRAARRARAVCGWACLRARRRMMRGGRAQATTWWSLTRWTARPTSTPASPPGPSSASTRPARSVRSRCPPALLCPAH